MNKITMEKVLNFTGSLIGAIFLIAWNVAKVFLVLLGAAANAGPSGVSMQVDHLRETSRRQGDYWDD